MCNLHLAVLHGFGGCGNRVYARYPLPRPNEPKTDEPLYVVVTGISRGVAVVEGPQGQCKAYHKVLVVPILLDIQDQKESIILDRCMTEGSLHIKHPFDM